MTILPSWLEIRPGSPTVSPQRRFGHLCKGCAFRPAMACIPRQGREPDVPGRALLRPVQSGDLNQWLSTTRFRTHRLPDAWATSDSFSPFSAIQDIITTDVPSLRCEPIAVPRYSAVDADSEHFPVYGASGEWSAGRRRPAHFIPVNGWGLTRPAALLHQRR